ncbi:uncharacterized protein LOC131306820 [Rhododendron vialii]|uniref:uncharacterized protein LOC131306820 n=1 Tax=Rhododendron vialii TaxID=182163 RepID=UPI00265FEC8E|nr:uncharacterized protein LOC131306820 [Rhododendron vialii]
MPPRTRDRRGGAGNWGGRGRGVPPKDEVSQLGENPGGNPRAGAGRGAGVSHTQNQFARDLIAALAAANLISQAPRENAKDRAMVAMREFSHRNPPVFDGTSSNPLVADHRLAQICKLFRALNITEDNIRIGIVVVQLIGEADEWWESVLESRKDARRAARTMAEANEPDAENLTWNEFEAFFEEQYFSETSRENMRDQFEKLDLDNMTVSEYVQKFQSLSHLAPELVVTEKRKCRWFEKGLHNTVKRMVMAHRKMKFSEVVECAKSIEIPKVTQRNASVWEPRQSVGRARGALSRPPPVCYKCNQSRHIHAQCPHLEKAYYVCGKMDHLTKNCPQWSGMRNELGSVQQPRTGHNVDQQFGALRGSSSLTSTRLCQLRVLGLIRERVLLRLLKVQAPEASVVRGTFLLFNSFARVLFDFGASHSFIAASFVRALELDTESLNSPLFIETPLGGFSSLSRICKDCELLSTFHATIDCFKCRVRIYPPEGVYFEFHGERREPLELYLCGSRERESVYAMLASLTLDEDLSTREELPLVVREFPNVFHEELPSLPPERD